MNLNELWSGSDYAWFEWRGRGEVYRSNGVRVKVIRAFKRKASYENERLSGFAEVMLLDAEGNPKTNSAGEHITREVRARDLAMRWDAYEQEKQHRESQREKIAKEREEAEARENARRSLISERLVERLGISPNLIYNITDTSVQLSRKGLEGVLGIDGE